MDVKGACLADSFWVQLEIGSTQSILEFKFREYRMIRIYKSLNDASKVEAPEVGEMVIRGCARVCVRAEFESRVVLRSMTEPSTRDYEQASAI